MGAAAGFFGVGVGAFFGSPLLEANLISSIVGLLGSRGGGWIRTMRTTGVRVPRALW